MSDNLETFYIYYDGDDIGVKFEQAYDNSDIEELQRLSRVLAEIHQDIKEFVNLFGGVVIESGGDEGLLRISSTSGGVSQCILTMSLIWRRHGLTATIASGSTIHMAYSKVLDRKYKKRNFEVVNGKTMA